MIEYILVFKEGINRGSWLRLKNTVLTDARDLRRIADVPPALHSLRSEKQEPACIKDEDQERTGNAGDYRIL
jgi:hypothetical protein